MKIVSLFLLFFFAGCSLKTPPNQWQYNSANAFESYKTNFLSGRDVSAKSDLARAISHAKSSAQLQTLGRIYLGECALAISVAEKSQCEKYKDIQELTHDASLDAYYNFLTHQLTQEQIVNLPKKYQDFALHKQNLQFKEANADILKMDEVSSKLLAAALIKEHLTPALRDAMLESASFYGYKKAVLFWLHEAKNNTQDTNKKSELEKKISLLNTKD